MRHVVSLLSILALSSPAIVHAQDAPAFSVRVSVLQGKTGSPVANAPVLLRAARPKGPFEPTDPEPQREWAGVTDAQGVATFENIPDTLADTGLRIHALTTHDGVSFKSPVVIPVPGASISLPVFPKTFDPGVLVAKQVRTVIEPWEGYLVFSQMWTLTVRGDAALDTTLISDPAFARGVPLELPIKAQGINVMGASNQTKVVNSTVFFQGVLKPGEPVSIQLRYSMPAKSDRFTYTQRLDYPTEQFDVLVPVNTDYDKIRYLEDLELRSFDLTLGQRSDIPGLRTDREFIVAIGKDISPKSELSFQLRGLPFERSAAPWYVIAMGLLGAAAIIVFASSSRARHASADSRDKLTQDLRAELEATLDALTELEDDLDTGHVSARDYEFESSSLRARAALLIKKLEELGETTPGIA